jgi:predicted RNase H-like HicB family nuclease
MKKYAIVIEYGENNLSAYVPDLLKDGEQIPASHTEVAYVELPVAS